MTGPDNFEADFDLYKFLVEMADRVSARRGTANAFYVGALTTLITTLGLFESNDAGTYVIIVSCLAGIILSAVWWLQLRSYRDLNTAKFKVICEIERGLPWSPFTDEWETLKKDPISGWKERYAELSSVESIMPLLFVLLFVGQAVARLID